MIAGIYMRRGCWPKRVGPLVWYYADGLFWFRIFGRGLHIRDTDRHPLRFSERNGYRKMWTIRRLS